jgi:hypothetical protein
MIAPRALADHWPWYLNVAFVAEYTAMFMAWDRSG